MSRKEKNDGRLRAWLPKNKRWVREALEHVVAMRELEEGAPSSVSLEIVRILEEKLKWFDNGKKDKKGVKNRV